MPSNFSPTFYIGSIRIGTVEGASSVNLGHNTNAGVKSEKKHNQGFGSISGDGNEFIDAQTLLDDGDALDMFNGDSNEDIPEWMKEKILASIQEEMADTSIEQEPEDIDDDEDSKKPKS